MKLKEKMKNNNHKKFDKKKLIGTISKKHIKNGSYTMVMSVVFIAVVVVLNMIVNAIPSKYSEIDISSWISAPRNFTPSVMRQKRC